MQSIIQKKSYNSVKVFYLDKNLLSKKIKKSVQKISNCCSEVNKIILFGSFCENRETVASDIDILIIVKNTPERFIDRPLKYIEFFEDINFDIDIFVYTEQEIKKRIPIVESALKKGSILFERKN